MKSYNEMFKSIHEEGSKSFEGVWLIANEAAVNEMRTFGVSTINPRFKAFVSSVVLKTLQAVKQQLADEQASDEIPY